MDGMDDFGMDDTDADLHFDDNIGQDDGIVDDLEPEPLESLHPSPEPDPEPDGSGEAFEYSPMGKVPGAQSDVHFGTSFDVPDGVADTGNDVEWSTWAGYYDATTWEPVEPA